MTTTSVPSVDPGVRARNVQREADIETLKLARERIIAVQNLLVRYDQHLASELASPCRKVEEALAWLLFRREMDK